MRYVLLAMLFTCISRPLPGDEFEQMTRRLTVLEQQNQLLQQQLSAIQTAGYVRPDPSCALPPDNSGCADPAEGCDGDGKKDDPLEMTVRWNHGMEAMTKDKKFRVHVGGRVQMDAIFLENSPGGFVGSGPTGDQDSVNFRRARLRIDGTMYEFIDWAAEYDFVNNVNVNPGTTATESNIVHVPAPTDLWVNFKTVPVVGNVRVGNFKEPIGLEHLHSSRFLDFLERSYNQDAFNGAFNNGFTPGLMIWDTYDDEHGTWATGVFKNVSNVFAYGVGDGEYAWTSRLTWLPYFDDDSHGAHLLHFGVSTSLRDPNNGTAQYRTRASLRNGPGGLNPVIANTGLFATDMVTQLNGEVAWQMDSLLIEGEYLACWNSDSFGNGVSAPAGAALGNVYLNGWYAQALYFLTGEHREYEKKAVTVHRFRLVFEKSAEFAIPRA